MRSLALMVLLVLGLLAVAPVMESKDALQDEDRDLLGLEDLLDDQGDITSMDDALRKAKVLRIITAMIEEAEQMEHQHTRKRGFKDFFNGLKNATIAAKNKISAFFKKTWNKAKAAFNIFGLKERFQTAVNKLVPYIHSDMTVNACTKVCEKAAIHIFGHEADEAHLLCLPTCDGALAKVERIAG